MKKTFEIVNKEDFSEFLPFLNTKTLIIWGEKDKIVPLKYAYLIKERIPNSELKILPKISHSPHLEAPEKLSGIILQFIQS
jgi:pimeloyl-ACP methyl ester carboxylesterase